MKRYIRIFLFFLLALFFVAITSSSCDRHHESTSSVSSISGIDETPEAPELPKEYSMQETPEESVKYHKCKSFIQEGVKYVFSRATLWHKTVPSTQTSYNYGEVLFEDGYMFLAFGNERESYRIINAIYEEVNVAYSTNPDIIDKIRAQFSLENDGLYFYAKLELGVNHSFTISDRLDSKPDLHYYLKETMIPPVHSLRCSMFLPGNR